MSNWNEIVEKVAPLIVKIETPSGHGTGFLCLYNENRSICGIATAYHVVWHAEQWQEPIRITNYASTTNAFLREGDRIIFADPQKDSAILLVSAGKLVFPEALIPLLPTTHRLPIGVEVGWLGYPGIASTTLCFFSGNVSAWQESRFAYLIDGVAINGVSGGPVLYTTPTDGVQKIGTGQVAGWMRLSRLRQLSRSSAAFKTVPTLCRTGFRSLKTADRPRPKEILMPTPRAWF